MLQDIDIAASCLITPPSTGPRHPLQIHYGTKKWLSSKLLQTNWEHLLGSIPYYVTLYLLQHTSPQMCVYHSFGTLTQFRVMANPYKVPRLHSLDTPHSVGLLWRSDQPDADTFMWQLVNTYKGQTSMPPAGFELTIPESERLQTALYTTRPMGSALRSEYSVT
jgi:hypothetical protein